MLILKSLTFQNIGRFVEEQTIDFTQLGLLNQVDGKNHNTNGSSGAGKSTIFKALDYLFGLNEVSTATLQSRLTKEHILITGTFDYNGLPLKIERSRKLLIDLNGEITTGSSKLSEEKLDQIIGMPRDLFRKTMHKRQGEQGFFLQMGATEIHKFLTNCLGLEREQKKIATLDARIITLATKESSLNTTLESNKVGLEATKNAIYNLGVAPTSVLDPEMVPTLTYNVKHYTDLHNNAIDAMKAEMEEFDKDRPIFKLVPFDRTEIERLELEIHYIDNAILAANKNEQLRQSQVKSKISELQISISNSKNKEQLRQSEIRSKISANQLEQSKFVAVVSAGNRAKEDAVQLAKELQKVKNALCPTCDQAWINQASKDKETEILGKLQELKKLVIQGMEAQTKITTLEAEHKQLDSEVRPIESLDVATLTEQLNKIKPEAEPQAIPEAIELKLQRNFKDKELIALRLAEREYQTKENDKKNATLEEFRERRNIVHGRHQALITSTYEEKMKYYNELQVVATKIKNFEETKKRYDENFLKLEAQRNKYKSQCDKNMQELREVSQEIELAEDAKKAIKSYLSCSFDDALDSISEAATNMIRGIPNMGTATIQFEGLKERGNGTIKEEVNCVISMDGEIGIPVKSLSGGERSSVDLGIDLAIMAFIEERTGLGINILSLDEPFTGLDSQCCEDAIEMLKNNTSGKQIFLVDHNVIGMQTIESRLTVVRTGLTSTISVENQ